MDYFDRVHIGSPVFFMSVRRHQGAAVAMADMERWISDGGGGMTDGKIRV